jgi:hypothetical protein
MSCCLKASLCDVEERKNHIERELTQAQPELQLHESQHAAARLLSSTLRQLAKPTQTLTNLEDRHCIEDVKPREITDRSELFSEPCCLR